MKNILITGANSYIGMSFAKYARGKFNIESINVRDDKWKEFDFSHFDTVLHCAGIAHTAPKKDVPYMAVNCDLAVNIAKHAKTAGVKQFVFLSSMSVHDPKSPYGASKLAAEQKFQVLASDCFNICILRPPMVYGYGCKGNFPRLVKLATKLPFFANIKNQRSMIYIDNLSEFICQAIAENKTGTHNPQNTEYVNTTELVKLIADLHGRRMPTTKLFNPIIKFLQKKIEPFDKLFGNMTYTKAGDEADYNVVDFEDSVQAAVKGEK